MATLNINIKDALLTKEIDAVAAMNGWTETIPNPAYVEGGTEPQTIPNITKDAFFKKQIKAWARNQAVEYANRVAIKTVTASVEEDN